jgi:Arm DNA-binding domain
LVTGYIRKDITVAQQKLTKRIVEAADLKAARYVIWDTQVRGFGIRVTSFGVKTFFLRYRPKGSPRKKRYLTLGRYGIVTVEEARESARRKLGAVANGDDPARDAELRRAAPTLAFAAK